MWSKIAKPTVVRQKITGLGKFLFYRQLNNLFLIISYRIQVFYAQAAI